MSNLKIIDFDFDDKLLKKFINFGYDIYKNDNKFIPPFRKKIEFELSNKNPFFNDRIIRNFIIYDDNIIKGRISAIINKNLTNIGYIGYFECVDDYEIAKILLDNVIEFLKRNNIKEINAPINFSTWNKYRFVTEGFDNESFILEPYNHKYYALFFEKYGFTLLKNYYSNIVTDIEREMTKIERIKEKALQNGYYIRNIDLKKVDEELLLLYNLTIEIFKNNFAYTEIDFDDFKNLYSGLNYMIKPEYLLFAYDKNNNVCGFLFGMPDYSLAFKKMNGKSDIFSKLKFLFYRSKAECFIMKTFGVKKTAIFSGVGSLLVYTMYKNMKKNGFNKGIHALMIENNSSRKYGLGTTDIIKKYSLYRYENRR